MLAPPVIVIHGTELVAVHAQRPPVVTATLPLWPVDCAETLVGATLYEHCASTDLTSRTKSNAISTAARRSITPPPI
jgi:hypothetical protein